MTKEANKNLAEYCFAILHPENVRETSDAPPQVVVTPLAFFKKHGHVEDVSITDLVPGCAEVMDGVYEFTNPAIKTVEDAARHMLEQGFIWNNKFQDFIDSDQLEIVAGVNYRYEETLARQFKFMLIRDEDMGGLFAVVSLKDDEDYEASGCSHAIMSRLCPEAKYVSDCVYGLWKFPSENAAEVAKILMDRGFRFDIVEQNKSLLEEIKPALPVSPPKRMPPNWKGPGL